MTIRPLLLAVVLLATSGCGWFGVHAFRAPTGSMAPTIKKGETFLVIDLGPDDKAHLRRGDIVAFRWPRDPQRFLVKRIVALAGDEVRVEAERLLVNGKPAHEPYATWTEAAVFEVAPDYKTRSPELFDVGPVVVPIDSVYVLSDNRSDDSDSRALGAIVTSNVVGRVLFKGP